MERESVAAAVDQIFAGEGVTEQMNACLLDAAPHGLSELLACLSVIVLQCWKGNMYLSIVVGTAVYMLLIRLL